MNVVYCAGPCVFDGDVRSEGGYDSLRPLDQWLRFGLQPSPDTETTTYKQPSVRPFFLFLSVFGLKNLNPANATLCFPTRSRSAAPAAKFP